MSAFVQALCIVGGAVVGTAIIAGITWWLCGVNKWWAYTIGGVVFIGILFMITWLGLR